MGRYFVVHSKALSKAGVSLSTAFCPLFVSAFVVPCFSESLTTGLMTQEAEWKKVTSKARPTWLRWALEP